MDRKDAQSILNGLMLGDGSLDLRGGGNAYFRLARQASNKEEEEKAHNYLSGIAEALRTLGVELSPNQPTTRAVGDKKMIDLWSRSSPLLTDLYNRWISPTNGPKRKVPKNLRLTPRTLTAWFESDGCTLKRGNSVTLELHSCQFGLEGNVQLRKLLEGIGITTNLHRRWDRRTNKEYWSLCTSKASNVNRFLDMVEPHIHPLYRYKVKRPSVK